MMEPESFGAGQFFKYQEIFKNYALNVRVYAQNMHSICHYIDFNMQIMQNICTKYGDVCKKYANNMHKYAQSLLKICKK